MTGKHRWPDSGAMAIGTVFMLPLLGHYYDGNLVYHVQRNTFDAHIEYVSVSTTHSSPALDLTCDEIAGWIKGNGPVVYCDGGRFYRLSDENGWPTFTKIDAL